MKSVLFNNTLKPFQAKSLILLMILVSQSIGCMAQAEFTADNVIYKVLSASTASVTGGGARIINIPDTVIYGGCKYRIIGIEKEAFKDNTSIVAVNFPKNLAYIKDRAFSGCTSIRSLSLGKVGHIYKEAFAGCCRNQGGLYTHSTLFIERADTMDNQTELRADNLIIEQAGNIAGSLFDRSTNNLYLKQLTIARRTENTTNFDIGFYTGNRYLHNVNLPVDTCVIKRWAFAGCYCLTNLKIPQYIKRIWPETFDGCTNLHTIYIEDSKDYLTLGYGEDMLTGKTDTTFADCDIMEMYIGRDLDCNIFMSKEKSKEYFRTLHLGNQGTCFYSLHYCYGLQNIYVPWKEPVELSSNLKDHFFNSTIYENATLHVPEGAKEGFTAQEKGNFWNNFKTTEEVQGNRITWPQEDATIINVGETLEFTAQATNPIYYTIVEGSDKGRTAKIVETANGYGLLALRSGAVLICARQDGGWKDFETRYFIIKDHKKAQTISIEGDKNDCMVSESVTLKTSISSDLSYGYEITEGKDRVKVSSTDGTFVLTGKQSGTVTIGFYQDGNDEYLPAYKSFTVTFNSKQIEWDCPDEMAIGDSIALTAKSADAVPTGYEITEGGDCAFVAEKDGVFLLVGKKAGTVKIKALMPQSEYYDADSLYRSIEITRIRQTITWENLGSMPLRLGDTIMVKPVASSQLPVTCKMIEGSTYADFIEKDGNYYLAGKKITKYISVVLEATQTGNEDYFPKTVTNRYGVFGKVQTINWEKSSVFTELEDTILLDATADSGLPITYSVGVGKDYCKIIEKDGQYYLVILSNALNQYVAITARQAGNDEYADTYMSRGYNVVKEQLVKQTLKWEQSACLKENETIELTATSSSGLPVIYFITDGADCAEIEETDGVYKLKGLKEGNVTVKAKQIGDRNYRRVSMTRTFSVTNDEPALLPQTITWEQSDVALCIGQEIVLSASASSQLPISYKITEGDDCVELIQAEGIYTLRAVREGTVSVEASQAGNETYSAAGSVVMKFTISAKKTQTITWNQDIEIAKGTTLAMQAVSSSGLPVTYTGDKPEGAFALPASISGAEIVFDAPGPYILYAHQEGNDEYEAAEPVKMEFNVLDEKYDDLMYIDGIYYRYADGNKNSLMAVRGYKKYVGDVVIPEYVNGLPVVTIDVQTFYACYGLNSVVVGENVKLMGAEAFGACKNLASATIPSECDIADWCYNASPNIKEIHCHATTPYNVREYIFNGYTDYTTCILYVPRGTKELYEQADVWKNFTNIVEEDQPSGISTATWANGEVNIYTLSGLLVRAKAKDTRGLRPGIYIAGGKKLVVR